LNSNVRKLFKRLILDISLAEPFSGFGRMFLEQRLDVASLFGKYMAEGYFLEGFGTETLEENLEIGEPVNVKNLFD
jgi:hypothetical protein